MAVLNFDLFSGSGFKYLMNKTIYQNNKNTCIFRKLTVQNKMVIQCLYINKFHHQSTVMVNYHQQLFSLASDQIFKLKI